MRVVMLVDSYYPRTTGGVQLYVRDLSQHLAALGHDVHFAIAEPGGESSDEVVESIPLHRFAFPEPLTADERRMLVRPRRFEEFGRWLADLAPDVLHAHMHAFPVLLPAMECAHELDIRTAISVHTATFTCRRIGTRPGVSPLLRFGATQCDGELTPLRCTACILQGRGLPTPFAVAAAGAEAVAALVAPKAAARVGEAATLPLVLGRARHAIARLGAAVQDFVVIADWQRRALVASGVPSDRVKVVRHGFHAARHSSRIRADDRVILGWAGRGVPEKGLRELVEAFARLDDDRAVLLLACLATESAEREYRDASVSFTAHDPRVRWIAPFESEDAERFYGQVDVLVAPYAIETGPLTVVEALGRGIPVIGSDHGGIRELVRDGENGRLVPYRDRGALTAAMREALDERTRARWTANAAWRRTFDDVVADHLEVYGGRPSGAESLDCGAAAITSSYDD